jgi:hypothetical protein
MKKTSKIIIAILLFASLWVFNSCDNLSEIPLNIPIETHFTLSGSETSVHKSVPFCLNQYKEWTDNKDKLNSVSFIATSYWTEEFSPSGLKGTIRLSLKDKTGITLFEVVLPNVSPADYLENPYKITLTSGEVDAFNAYLQRISEDSNCTTPSFIAEMSMTNITGGTPYEIKGKVEIILEAIISQ